jgi:hypothetical protein
VRLCLIPDDSHTFFESTLFNFAYIDTDIEISTIQTEKSMPTITKLTKDLSKKNKSKTPKTKNPKKQPLIIPAKKYSKKEFEKIYKEASEAMIETLAGRTPIEYENEMRGRKA